MRVSRFAYAVAALLTSAAALAFWSGPAFSNSNEAKGSDGLLKASVVSTRPELVSGGDGLKGFPFGPLQSWERMWAFGSAAMLIAALPMTDEIGFALSAAFLAWHFLSRHRRVGNEDSGSRRGGGRLSCGSLSRATPAVI